jgi:transcriptional regulator with PAS, ATPase and Fis domain
MKTRDMVFASKEMELVLKTVEAVAPTASPVLIEGESGTGKELIARLVHSRSRRRERPFFPVNCGAIPDALFESEIFGHLAGSFTGAIRDKAGILEAASGGTLFLDEIGDLALHLQAKLLRVLQENEFRRIGDTRTSTADVRVISATNRDLEEEVKQGRFREDLYFRVSVLRICVEPLRSRPDDISVLAEHFAAGYAAAMGKEIPRLDGGLLEIFRAYPWPGNVRELENEIQRLIAFSGDGTIGPAQVSKRIRAWVCERRSGSRAGSLRERVADFEKEIIHETLVRYSWNKSECARRLGLTRQGLHRKVRRLGIVQRNPEVSGQEHKDIGPRCKPGE